MSPTGSQGNMQHADSNFVGPTGGRAAQDNPWAIDRGVDDLDVIPTDPLVSTTHGLHCRFLGSPAFGEVLGGIGRLQTILDFVGRIDTLQKLLAVCFDHFGNSHTFDNFGPGSDNGHPIA